MSYPLFLRTGDTSLNERLLQGIVRAVARVGREAQPETFAHVQPHAHATAQLVRHFAARFGLSGRALAEIEFVARMHDIGKYFIASSILLKPGALTKDERAIMSLHSLYGAVTISKLSGTTDTIRYAVLHHHEHWDGSGYPEGLVRTRIPLQARIVSVVDVYTSLRARRSYKSALTKFEALGTMVAMAGRELDPCIVEDFIKLLRHPEQWRQHSR
jgi:HD-GYP domain-containing protein (c-di-GMP phosphodiesterase class II)